MTITLALILAALAAGVYLSMGNVKLSPSTVAAGVAAMELAFNRNWFRFSLGNLPLQTIFAVTLAVCGFMLYQRESNKQRVAAGMVILIVGALQTLKRVL